MRPAFSAAVLAPLVLSCIAQWELPSRSATQPRYAYVGSHSMLRIPEGLLQEPSIAELARDCAVLANTSAGNFRNNRIWATTFGGIQIGGAALAAVALGSAFNAGGTGHEDADRIAAVAMGIAAASAAIMAATQPDVLAERARSRSTQMGGAILTAASLQAAGDREGAARTLSRCSDLMHDEPAPRRETTPTPVVRDAGGPG